MSTAAPVLEYDTQPAETLRAQREAEISGGGGAIAWIKSHFWALSDQVLISGHGQMRSMELAGSPEKPDGIDLDENAEETAKLFEAILAHLDGETKHVVENLDNVHRRIAIYIGDD